MTPVSTAGARIVPAGADERAKHGIGGSRGRTPAGPPDGRHDPGQQGMDSGVGVDPMHGDARLTRPEHGRTEPARLHP